MQENVSIKKKVGPSESLAFFFPRCVRPLRVLLKFSGRDKKWNGFNSKPKMGFVFYFHTVIFITSIALYFNLKLYIIIFKKTQNILDHAKS